MKEACWVDGLDSNMQLLHVIPVPWFLYTTSLLSYNTIHRVAMSIKENYRLIIWLNKMSWHFQNDSLQIKAVRISTITEFIYNWNHFFLQWMCWQKKNYPGLTHHNKAYVIFFPVTIKGIDMFNIVQLTCNTSSSNKWISILWQWKLFDVAFQPWKMLCASHIK